MVFFKKVLELKPKHIDSTINLAHIYTKEEDYDTAKKLLSRALEINPNSKLAKIHLASLSLYEGNVDNALTDLSKLEEDSSRNKSSASEMNALINEIFCA